MKYLLALVAGILLVLPNCFSQTVAIHANTTVPQQKYGAAVLEKALRAHGYITGSTNSTFKIVFGLDSLLGAEAYAIQPADNVIHLKAGDQRGFIYGAYALAEAVNSGEPLSKLRARSEKPFLPFRAIKYDLPWDTYRHSDALELHDETCRDTAYWRAFLDMMAENRLNTLTLWNLHPYTYLIKPKNFPEASPWSDAEMKQWQTLFHAIVDMATERAIDTYIIPFNIFVTPQFAKAHGVALDNLDHQYFVDGDTSEIIKRYTRECVRQMLEEYPGLTGMGLTLGEGMGGMTPPEREAWMRETIIEGMRLANRKSKLIHRIPFSSTTGSLGITSIETEKLTRKAIEHEASLGFTEGPIWADLKFNWSHAHSTTGLMKVHGGKLYDTYFDPLPTDYKIVWTARNEDFFCLRWGVPSFVRRHVLDNARPWSGGYIIGSETYIPAKDYFTRDSLQRNWQYAFERQWLFYKLWGRLLYNPNTPDAVFSSEFTRRYGNRAVNLLQASSLAGSTALRIASAYDCGWDFTLYTEGMMALNPETKSVEYISVERLIQQPPLDTSLVSIANFIAAGATGNFKNKTTPAQLAAMLDKDCKQALAMVKGIDAGNNPALRQEVADIRAWAWLGLHFAEKIRGGLALQRYRVGGGKVNKQVAIRHLANALTHWDSLVQITRPLYLDMPLVHLSQQNGGKESPENFYRRFHWEMLRPEVARDVEVARAATVLQASAR